MTYTNTTFSQPPGQDLPEQLQGLPLFDPSAPLEGAPDKVADAPLDNSVISLREESEGSDDAGFELGPGGLIVKMPCNAAPPPGGKRGMIRGFSASSRRRLRRLNATVDWARFPAFFVGLTYHDDFPDSYLRGTADLQAFKMRLYRKLGHAVVAVEWRREWVRRKSGKFKGSWAPHFHLVIVLAADVPAFMLMMFVHRAWSEIVAPGDADHLEHGADVQRIYNRSGKAIGKLMAYLSKYISKECDGIPVDFETGECLDVGRSWGVWGHLPISKLCGTMSRADMATLLRRLRRWSDNRYANKLSIDWLGWLLFGDGEAMRQLLRGLESVQIVT